MVSDGEGFLGRWSKRKMGREAPPQPDPTPIALAPAQGLPAQGLAATPQAALGAASTPAAAPSASAAATPQSEALLAPPQPPPPTLDDVAKLTRESDYAPYVNRSVDPQVRNAAMKKLFSDPHFNVMDGLDTYIDDYGKPDPLPLAMLRQMTSARALGLFADEEAAEAKALAAAQAQAQTPPQPLAPAEPSAKASPDGEPPAVLAQSPSEAFEAPHEDTDLRLQPDDAAGRPGPDQSPGRAG